jgi:Na+/proline symporter
MTVLNLLILVCVLYVVLLFTVAFGADRAARLGRGSWLRSPIVYTLSLSIYCTAWTFYGAVGFAARSGLEFVTIYLGPTLVMIGWWWTLRRLVRVGRSQRITSIADLISSRYGKSNLLAVLVTVLAVIATTPYIALQLQSVTLAFAAFARTDPTATTLPDMQSTALWVAAGLAVFTILFGTRNLDANERHHGVVMAIALEAVVKLCALLAVGIFVVWGLAGGIAGTIARIEASEIARFEVSGARWIGLTMVSAMAFLCLPRMFQVLVVENEDEDHLRTSAWAFPGYLMLMSLFVLPIAAVGLDLLPEGANPDLFVLSLPLMEGRDGLAILSFLGGFSSATSMVIVAAIALSTMVSNHVVMPLWLHYSGTAAMVSGDVRNVALMARRLSIAGVLFLGYVYFRISGGGTALAAIGLIAFVGVAQFLPALMGGLFWRGATRTGALAGLSIGAAIWLYCLFRGVLAAAARAVLDRRDGSRDPRADVVAHAQSRGLSARLAAELSTTAGAASGSAVRQCLRPFRHAGGVVGRHGAKRGPAHHVAAHHGRARGAGALCLRRRAAGRGGLPARAQPRFPAGARARAGGLGRRGHGPCHDRADRGRCRRLGRGSDGRGRRDRADHGIFQPARGQEPGAGAHRAAAAAGQREAHADLGAEGRVSQPDQPRVAHAHDLDPRLLRDPARHPRSRSRGTAQICRDHP